MDSTIRKRSIVLDSGKTSISIEDPFWTGVRDIAVERGISIRELIGEIDQARDVGNLSSNIRLAVLEHYRDKASKAVGVAT